MPMPLHRHHLGQEAGRSTETCLVADITLKPTTTTTTTISTRTTGPTAGPVGTHQAHPRLPRHVELPYGTATADDHRSMAGKSHIVFHRRR